MTMRLDKRVADLEARQPSGRGAVHRFIQEEGQSYDEALARYDKDVGPDDFVIVRRPVNPRPDGEPV